MVNTALLRASDGTGEAVRATVSGTRAIAATTLTVDTVANWPDEFIAVSGTLNESTGLITAGTETVFEGHLDTGNIIIDAFAPGYSDAGNSIGQVVFLKPTTRWADEIVDAFDVAHDADGGLNATALAEAATAATTAIEADSNFRTIPRLSTTVSTASLTPNIDNYNIYDVTALGAGMTINAPIGTPNDGDILVFRIKDDGTTRALTWNAAFQNVSGLATITTTTVSKWHVIGAMYSAAATKWLVVSITTEA